LGALEKLRKATTSLVLPVCPSVHPSVHVEQLDSYWKDFHEIRYFISGGKEESQLEATIKVYW